MTRSDWVSTVQLSDLEITSSEVKIKNIPIISIKEFLFTCVPNPPRSFWVLEILAIYAHSWNFMTSWSTKQIRGCW